MPKKLGIVVLSFLLLISVMPWVMADESCIVDILCVDSNQEPVSGVVVEALRENNGTWQQATSNESGKVYFEMENGNYSVTVNQAPDGYRAAQEKYYILIKASTPYLSDEDFYRTHDYETITFINESEKPAGKQRSFSAYVLDDNNQPVAGVKMKLESKGKTYTAATDAEGMVTFTAINGSYTLSESEAPTGYKKSRNTYTIVLNTEGVFLSTDTTLEAYKPVTFVNQILKDEINPEQLYSVLVYVKGVDGKPLDGAVLTLTSQEDTVYQKFTDKNGQVEFKVPSGEYILNQTGGTEFFDLVYDYYKITVSPEGLFFTDTGEPYQPITYINPLKSSSISSSTPESLLDANQKIVEANTIPDLIKDKHMAYLFGYENRTFAPNQAITRAEVALMLALLSGVSDEALNESQAYIGSFKDIVDYAWYTPAINYLEDWEILKGYDDQTFRPNAPITRAEFVTLISKFHESVPAAGNIFSDVPDSYWAAAAINSAAVQGFITGYQDGTFQPNANITKAETAALMNNILGRKADQNYINQHQLSNSFTDCLPDYWAYYEVMEATNGHNFTVENGREVWY